MKIDECLEIIKSAIYGKDVRNAIHDAIEYLKNNMAGIYTLPVASKDALGGIKLGDEFQLNDNKQLIFKKANVKSELWSISEAENMELYNALNKLGTSAHVLTSTVKNGNKTRMLQICVSADGYALPVYRIHNGTAWSEYMKFNGFGLSNEFSINKYGNVEHSLSYKLWLMQYIIEVMIESDYISIEDISDDFIESKSSNILSYEAEVYKTGYSVSGTITLKCSTIQYLEEELFRIAEQYRPLNSKGVVCACQTYTGTTLRNDSNITFLPDGFVKFAASDDAYMIDKIVFSFSYHSLNGIV